MFNEQSNQIAFESFGESKRSGCYCKKPIEFLNAKPAKHALMPLKHIDYSIKITNGLASVTLQQKYVNPTDKFLQIEFSFPIDPNSCIYKFVAEFGNKRVEGVVKEKEQAKKEYQQAIKEGKQAVYAEIDPNSKDIINMEIGNVAPGQEVKISISYLQELNIEQNTFYQFHLPSTISPRYMNFVPGRNQYKKQVNGEVVKGEFVKGEFVKGEYTWNFKIVIETTRKQMIYNCQSHKLALLSQNQNKTQTILILEQGQIPNKDLFLLFSVENFHLPSYVLGNTDTSSTLMLSFIPKFCELNVDDALKASLDNKPFQVDLDSVKGQYVFLLDRSGSMDGHRIQKAKQALVLFLQSLPQDTYFNVVSFGSNQSLLFKQSLKYNNQNISEAINQIKGMYGDMGGTQIYQPLYNQLRKATIPGYPRQIFLLTDGQVSDTEGVIRMVSKNTKYTRCHSIGIGNGCSEALIKGSAEKGKGKYIFIQDSQNPSEKIIGLLEQTLTPVIQKVSLEFDKQVVESVVPNPECIPYVLKNEVMNFYINLKQRLDKKVSFKFGYKDTLNNCLFESIIQIQPTVESGAEFVDKMGHFKIIRNLQQANNDDKNIEDLMYYVKVVDKKKEAIEHSIKNQILSQFTAFICVQKQILDGKYHQVMDKGQVKMIIEPYQDPQQHFSQIYQNSNYQIRQQMMKSFQTSGGVIRGASMSSGSDDQQAECYGNSEYGVDENCFQDCADSKQEQCQDESVNENSYLQRCCMIQQQCAIQNENIMCEQIKQLPTKAATTGVFESIKNGFRSLFKGSEQKQQIRNQSAKMQSLDYGNIMVQQCCDSQMMDEPDINSIKRKTNNKKMHLNIQKQQQGQGQAICQQAEWKDNKKKDTVKQVQILGYNVTIELVLKQQKVDGSFNLEQLLSKLYGVHFIQIKKQVQLSGLDINIVITYLVGKWIQKNHPQKQYSLVIKKCYNWIKKNGDLTQIAKRFDQFV